MSLSYQILLPNPSLNSWISYYWVLKEDDSSPVSPELMIPDGHAEIIFNLNNEPYNRTNLDLKTQQLSESYIIGSKLLSVYASRQGRIDMVGIKLNPEALNHLFRESSKKFTDLPVEFSAFGNGDLTRLQQKLMEAESSNVVKGMLDTYFLAHLSNINPNSLLNHCQYLIIKNKGNVSVNDLSKQVNVSVRTLRRYFLEHIGLSPKAYARVIRFKLLYNSLRNMNLEYTSEFWNYGFYDQNHFIKEFKFFTQSTPTSFLKNKIKCSTYVTDSCFKHELMDNQS